MEGCFGPPEGRYSSLGNHTMDCPCRDCFHGGRFGGYAMKPGYVCPYNKRIAIKAFEDINRLISALGALIEDVAVSLGVEVKARGLFTKDRAANRFAPKSPVEAVNEKPGMGSGESGISGEIKEHGG